MERFEWDNNKRQINLNKHGIDFVDAIGVFSDICRIEAESERNNEIRYQTMGMIAGMIILVVYTYRNERKRIISARRASQQEREVYNNLR